MSYYFNAGNWFGVFAVPNSIVDKHIKLAGENEIKAILWTLRHSGELFTAQQLSDGTGISMSCVDDALEFWIQRGIIAMDGNNMIQGKENLFPSTSKSNFPSEHTENSGNADRSDMKTESSRIYEPVVERRMLRPDGVQIAKRMNEDQNIAHMMQETEAMLGKTLSPSLAAVLLVAHDDYSLPPEVIILIISYAKSIGKIGTAYIEALTKNWSEDGIFTLQDAEKKLNELSRHTMAWKKVSGILGIPMRSATKKEDEFSFGWVYGICAPAELIREAYERCINNIGKLQMKYIDKILNTWMNLGLSSVQAVYEYEEKQKLDKSSTSQTTYDINELEGFNVFSDWKQEKK